MKTMSTVFLLFLLSIGHSYAEGEKERAPHEKVLEFESVMNGNRPVQLKDPTSEFGEKERKVTIYDSLRFPTVIEEGRSPAVLDNEEGSKATSR